MTTRAGAREVGCSLPIRARKVRSSPFKYFARRQCSMRYTGVHCPTTRKPRSTDNAARHSSLTKNEYGLALSEFIYGPAAFPYIHSSSLASLDIRYSNRCFCPTQRRCGQYRVPLVVSHLDLDRDILRHSFLRKSAYQVCMHCVTAGASEFTLTSMQVDFNTLTLKSLRSIVANPAPTWL